LKTLTGEIPKINWKTKYEKICIINIIVSFYTFINDL
jgi:hypothetical protein